MKKLLLYFVGSIVILGIVLVASNTQFPFFSAAVTRDMVYVTATVVPERIIVVDNNLTIQEIYSNTSKTVQPTVFLDSTNGPQVDYSITVDSQYQKLKPNLDFNKTGLIYVKNNHPIQNFFNRVWQTVSGWF